MPLEIRCMLSDPKSKLILLSVKKAKNGKCELLICSTKVDSDCYRANSKNVKEKLEV